jgi:hypothetical protein
MRINLMVWSLGQVLGYDGSYDSGTCPHGYYYLSP